MLDRQDPAHHPRRRDPGRQPERGRRRPRAAAIRPACPAAPARARRCSPGACATRSGSPSTPTRRHALLHQRRGPGPWEEIDRGQKGADYGWNVREGHCANGSTTDCGAAAGGHDQPDLRLQHARRRLAVRGLRSITGGAFVPRACGRPTYDGTYLFADYVCGKIFRLTRDAARRHGGVVRHRPRRLERRRSDRSARRRRPSRSTTLTYANGGEVRRIATPARQSARRTAALRRQPDVGRAAAHASPSTAPAEPRSRRRRHAHLPVGLRRRRDQTTTTPTTSAHLRDRRHLHARRLRVRDNHGATSARGHRAHRRRQHAAGAGRSAPPATRCASASARPSRSRAAPPTPGRHRARVAPELDGAARTTTSTPTRTSGPLTGND